MLVTNDLVDKVKPGDRIEVVGVYKPLTGSGDGGGYQRDVPHSHHWGGIASARN